MPLTADLFYETYGSGSFTFGWARGGTKAAAGAHSSRSALRAAAGSAFRSALLLAGAAGRWRYRLAHPHRGIYSQSRRPGARSVLLLARGPALVRLGVAVGSDLRAVSSLVGAGGSRGAGRRSRSEEHTSELQSLRHLVCRLL